jgi:hypothetical protein
MSHCAERLLLYSVTVLYSGVSVLTVVSLCYTVLTVCSTLLSQ